MRANYAREKIKINTTRSRVAHRRAANGKDAGSEE
jgi:hypothetical protein